MSSKSTEAPSESADPQVAKSPDSELSANTSSTVQMTTTPTTTPTTSSPSTETAPGPNAKPETKITFIAMLFALAVGEIAVQMATLVQAVQAQRPAGRGPWEGFWDARCALMHLALVLALVACSWIGWSHSKATGNQEDTKDVFGIGFLVLLLDLWLVIAYFVIAKGVDRIVSPPGAPVRFVNERETEALWVLVTFIGYAVWDALTKLRRNPSEFQQRLRRLLTAILKRYMIRSWVSLVCMALAFVVYESLPNEIPSSGEPPNGVLLTDGALLSLVFLFRALKQASDKRSRRRGVFWAIIMFGGGVTCYCFSLVS